MTSRCIGVPSSNNMATAAELTTQFARLDERVANHIKFLWAIVGVAFIIFCAIGGELYHLNSLVSSLVSPHDLAVAATQPTLPTSQAAVSKIIAKAKESQNPIPVSTLASAAKSFSSVAGTDPQSVGDGRAANGLSIQS